MSDGSPQHSGVEIHTAVFTDTADYHTAGADMQDKVVRSNCLMNRESSHSNNEELLKNAIFYGPEIN